MVGLVSVQVEPHVIEQRIISQVFHISLTHDKVAEIPESARLLVLNINLNQSLRDCDKID